MPNFFAYTLLLLWPVISLQFFRKLNLVQAVFWTIVGGHMFLPVRTVFDLPLIPPLNKESIASICALIGCVYVKKIKNALLPEYGIERALVLILLLLPIFTVITNSEPVYNGETWIQGLTFRDAISYAIAQYIALIPFILGVRLIKSKKDMVLILKLFVVAGLVYSVLILIELRMSPQLNRWIYGFTPPGWIQNIRMGGFRPLVFMGHGLWVAFFMLISFISMVSLWKAKIEVKRISLLLAIIYLSIILWFCKTWGAYILASLFFILISFMPIYIVKRAIQIMTLSILIYPILSITRIFPHQEIVDYVFAMNPERADSLAFRFKHESLLLEHAQNKIYFGWGSWGRNRLYDSVTDGYWIIVLGIKGAIGFASIFGLMALTIYRGLKASSLMSTPNKQRFHLSLVLIVTLVMTDQLPNASISPYLWFIVGSILGLTNTILQENKKIQIPAVSG